MGSRGAFRATWDILLGDAEGMTMAEAAARGFRFHPAEYAIPESQSEVLLGIWRLHRGRAHPKESEVGMLWMNMGPGSYQDGAQPQPPIEASERLESEFRAADEVLWHLVAGEVRRAAVNLSPERLSEQDELAVTAARGAAMRLVVRWRATTASPLSLVARQAVGEALAAEYIRGRLPELAEHLANPWQSAVWVRGQLRELGPDAEEVALRLLPTWRLPLRELPTVAATLIPDKHSSVAQGRRSRGP